MENQNNIFIISTSLEGNFKYNTFYWSGKYLSDILDNLEVDYNSLFEIKTAILYFNKSDQKFRNALQLKITKVEAKQNYLKIYLEIEKTLELQSYQIKDALKKQMNLKTIYDLPYLYVIDNNIFYNTINETKINSTIKTLEEKNNWQEIYNLYKTFEPIETNKIWNDAKLLNSFSFATAKLSECTENLKRKFPDKTQRKNYIEEKRKLRNLTIKLRLRTIELSPQNSSYHSNLAYTYYQSVNELTTPGGRKDGNIFEEALLALNYINKALELNPKRLNDLYRKAKLYSDILGTYKFFQQNEKDLIEEKFTEYDHSLSESIKHLNTIIDIYNSITNTEEKQKNKKIFIKALYNLAQIYLRQAKLKYNSNNKNDYTVETNETITKLQLADKNIDKCITNDYNKKKEEKEIFQMANTNNFIYGVYKTYLKATIQLYLYLTTKEKKYETTARNYYQLSIETNFPKEMKNQNKIFILEKMAVLNLATEKYQAAIKTLETIYNKYQNLPPYAAYTLSIAYQKNNQSEKALQIIEKYINHTNDIFKYKFEKIKEQIITNNYTQKTIELTQHLYENIN